jgi:hypothetical protein
VNKDEVEWQEEVYLLKAEDVSTFYRTGGLGILSKAVETYIAAGTRTKTEHGDRVKG